MDSLQGTLPGYTLGEGCVLDLRCMPPAVAEVYTIAVLQHLQRGRNPRCLIPIALQCKDNNLPPCVLPSLAQRACSPSAAPGSPPSVPPGSRKAGRQTWQADLAVSWRLTSVCYSSAQGKGGPLNQHAGATLRPGRCLRAVLFRRGPD